MRAASFVHGLVPLALAATFAACGPIDPNAPNRTPLAEKWLIRAKKSYRAGDFMEKLLQHQPEPSKSLHLRYWLSSAA